MKTEEIICRLEKYISLDSSKVEHKRLNNKVSFLRMRDIINKYGCILEADDENKKFIATIKAGFLNQNIAYLVISLGKDFMEIYAFAREGIISQRTAVKAILKIENEILTMTHNEQEKNDEIVKRETSS